MKLIGYQALRRNSTIGLAVLTRCGSDTHGQSSIKLYCAFAYSFTRSLGDKEFLHHV